MTVAVTFALNKSVDWKKSDPGDWDLSVSELTGQEKVLGHKQIDGAICKILLLEDGQVVAISK